MGVCQDALVRAEMQDFVSLRREFEVVLISGLNMA